MLVHNLEITVRVKCLAEKKAQSFLPGLEPKLLNLEVSALTMKPLCLNLFHRYLLVNVIIKKYRHKYHHNGTMTKRWLDTHLGSHTLLVPRFCSPLCKDDSPLLLDSSFPSSGFFLFIELQRIFFKNTTYM